MRNRILHRLLCFFLFLPLSLIVSVNPAHSALSSYQAAREYAPDNVCACPPDMMPAQLRATQPSRLAYNTYDSNSNRLTYGGTSYTISGTSNRMTAAGGTSITYTSAGNISGIGSDAFAYNKANQMATATVSGTASTYVYDAFGQRLKSTVGAGTPVIQQYGMGGLLLSETQGAAETNYVYLNGLPVAAINTASPALSYILTNHLGTPQVATNGGQSVVWSGAYQPFGAVSPTTSITQNLRFPGQYADPTGLHYNMFRNYNPALGRYMESDPIGLAGGINPYVYVENNPYSFVDPLGLQEAINADQRERLLGYAASKRGISIQAMRLQSGAVMDFREQEEAQRELNALPSDGPVTGSPEATQAQGTATEGANAPQGSAPPEPGCEDGNCEEKTQDSKRHSSEKEALREMIERDKRTGGITDEDFQAYKELNSELEDPFPNKDIHGPEQHPDRASPSSQNPHYHFGGVDHIPRKGQ